MTREELYEIWAPPGAIWTPWAKAVVFAQYQPEPIEIVPPLGFEAAWLHHSRHTAIVVDLPGAYGVEVGIRLARHGYRPVPLYNAVPRIGLSPELVDVRSIIRSLADRASELVELKLPFDARPAFLLDANRRGMAGRADPGQFDNRSICFPTDFPSAAFLSQQGINAALLISQSDPNPQADLSHVLRRWQEAGIKIFSVVLADNQPPHPIDVQTPSRFRSIWYGWLAALGLIRSPLGGFGGSVPFPGQWGAGG